MTTSDLYIIGAGGFGREVFSWVQDIAPPRWTVRGFIDDNLSALDGFEGFPPVLSTLADLVLKKGDHFVCAIGNPSRRLEVSRALATAGAEFPVILHPTVTLGAKCIIGRGCILCPGAVVTTSVRLGDFVIINANATVGHDAQIGDGVTLSGHVDITGGAVVEEGAFFGSHACVLPGARIGAFAKVGAGSVVLRTVKPGATVMGVPAKQILP